MAQSQQVRTNYTSMEDPDLVLIILNCVQSRRLITSQIQKAERQESLIKSQADTNQGTFSKELEAERKSGAVALGKAQDHLNELEKNTMKAIKAVSLVVMRITNV